MGCDGNGVGAAAPRHLAVVGPTGVGKTAVGLALARLRPDLDLVSVDSMSVYRGMDLGTAKPTVAERAGISYHLIDIVDPGEDFSVSRFRDEAGRVLADIEVRGRAAVLVGGTGLYVRALVDELVIPGRWPEVAAALEVEADSVGVRELHARLAEVDPLAAERIEPSNRRRVVRALEVTLGSGRPFSSYGPGLQAYPRTRFTMVGLELPLDQLYRRIEERFRTQVDAGLLDEVADLTRSPLSRTARQAVGYREMLAHLEDGLALERAIEEAVGRTRRLARRQLSWFRRDPRITWIDAGDNALAVADRVLGEWEKCPH